jgi:hypothetical protein
VRRLRPIILRLLAATLIGAAVTLGVAVACAMSANDPAAFTGKQYYWKLPHSDEVFAWNEWTNSRGTRTGLVTSLGEWRGFPRNGPEIVTSGPIPETALTGDLRHNRRMVRTAGWPYRAAWGSIDFGPATYLDDMVYSTPGPKEMGLAGAISVGREFNVNDDRGIGGYLPIAPIWSGLAKNTLFYAAIAWGLMFLPGVIRRWRRYRRGRCMNCGYDLKGLGTGATGGVCPECGSKSARRGIGLVGMGIRSTGFSSNPLP